MTTTARINQQSLEALNRLSIVKAVQERTDGMFKLRKEMGFAGTGFTTKEVEYWKISDKQLVRILNGRTF